MASSTPASSRFVGSTSKAKGGSASAPASAKFLEASSGAAPKAPSKSPVMRALELLDLPRATVVSGVHELADARVSGGPKGSFKDFFDQIRAHKGVGDYVHTGSPWANRAIGFAGDVAADPLTYVSGGAEQIGKGGAELGAKEAARMLIERGDEAAAAKVLQGGRNGAARLTSEELKSIGAKSGYRFAGQTIPGTEGALRAVTDAKAAVKAAAVDKLPGVDKLGELLSSNKALRKAAKTDPVGAFKVKELDTQLARQARAVGREHLQNLRELKTRYADLNGADILHVVEGGTHADPLVNEAADHFSQLYETLRTQAEDATGRTIPKREFYSPWVKTDEAKAAADEVGRKASTRGKQSFELRADLAHGDDSMFFGEKLEGTPAQRRIQVQEILGEKRGDAAVKLLKDDPYELAAGYIKGMQRYIRKYGGEKALADAGLTVEPELRQVENIAGKREQKAIRGEIDDALAEHGANQDQLHEAADKLTNLGNERATAKGLRREAFGARRDAAAAKVEKKLAKGEVNRLKDVVESLKSQIDNAAPVAATPVDTTPLKAKLDEAVAKLAKATDEHAAVAAEVPAAAKPDKVMGRLQELAAKVGATDPKALDAEEAALKAEHRQIVTEALATKSGKAADVEVFTSKGAADGAKAGPVRLDGANARGVIDNLRKGLVDPIEGLDMHEAARGAADRLGAQLDQNVTEATGMTPEASARIEEINSRLDEINRARTDRNSALSEAMGLKRQLESGEAAPAATRSPAQERKLKAAQEKVTQAKTVVEEHRAALDSASVATEGPTPADTSKLQSQLDDAKRDLKAASKRKKAAKEAAVANLEKAQSLFAEAEQHANLGRPQLAEVARLEAMVTQAEVGMRQNIRDAVGLKALHDSIAPITTRPYTFPDMLEDGLKQFANGKYAEGWVVDALQEIQGHLTHEAPARWLQTVDRYTALWKAYNLLTPGFHARNYMGGVFNNMLAGVEFSSARDYVKYRRVFLKEGADALPEGPIREAFQHIDAEVWDTGHIHDISDIAQGADSGRALLGTPNSAKNPLSQEFKPLQINRKVGQKVEDNLRGTLFYDRYLKTGSVTDGLDAVDKYHFDYNDLSQVEQKYVKRIIPFYTWTRKNFPLQLEMMAKKPGAYTSYLHAKRNLELGVPGDSVVPDYYGSLLAIRSPFKSGKGDPIYLTPDLPFRDLAETFDVNKNIGQLNPLIKTPLEAAANKQFYSNIPFSGTPKKVPVTMLPVAAALIPLQGKFGLPKVMRGKDGSLFMSDKDMYKVEQTLPIFGRLRRTAPSEPKYQDRALTTYLSFLGGIGARTLTQSEIDGELLRRKDATSKRNKLQKVLG